MQEMESPSWAWPMQAWLQAMQARMSSLRPALALFGISGSQIKARVMPQISAAPAARIRSASWGWLMRPATKTGLPIACFSVAAKGARYPLAKLMGGTIWIAPDADDEVPPMPLQ